jgi:uncharacterized protein YbgA (DUF1722 family)/uncharacterized protein YbbK (DUF523 family)
VTSAAAPARGRPRLGISACLLGAEVRFDGQHKANRFLIDELGALVDWLPVCPELEAGMGVPRESVRLVRGRPGEPRLLGSRSGEDWTERMTRTVTARVGALGAAGLAGYVLESRSPTCGMERVKLYPAAPGGGAPTREGTGLFAAELARQLPNLPLEEGGRLGDARLRENFVERVFVYERLQRLWGTDWTTGALVAFHTAHKMTLLAHSTQGYGRLGRLVAAAGRLPRAELRAGYERELMAVLKTVATPGRQANVLMHMLGHLRGRLDPTDRQELLGLIEEHRRGVVPLVVPVALLRHHVDRQSITYLRAQSYLDPHPRQLGLRNGV